MTDGKMDREKVIRGLECCARYYEDGDNRACAECPYREPLPITCMSLYPLMKDALDALKGQEAAKDGEGTNGEPSPV